MNLIGVYTRGICINELIVSSLCSFVALTFPGTQSTGLLIEVNCPLVERLSFSIFWACEAKINVNAIKVTKNGIIAYLLKNNVIG
jgi:hypothetical protein